MTRLEFKWTEQDLTIWMAVSSIGSSFAILCFMQLFSYKLKWHDAIIGIIGAIFGTAANLIQTFASYSWLFYLSSGVGLVSQVKVLY